MKKYRKMSKKGSLDMVQVIIAGVVLLVLGFGMFAGYKWLFANPQDTQKGTDDTGIPSATSDTFCDQNPSLDLDGRVEDEITRGTNGLNATIVVLDKNGGAVSENTIDTANEGTTRDTFTNVIPCGSNVEVGILTKQDTGSNNGINSNRNSFKEYTSLAKDAKDANKQQHTKRDPVKFDGTSSKFSAIQVRVYDEDARGYVFNGSVRKVADTDASTFRSIVGTATNYSSTTANATKDVDAGGQLVYTIELKTVLTDRQAGELTGVWVDYLDSDSTADDWSEPTLRLNGVKLERSENTVSNQDVLANNGYEAFYSFGHGIRDSSEKLTIEAKPNSGEDPDNAIILKVVGAGISVSSVPTNGIISDVIGRDRFTAFANDQARTQIVSSFDQVMRLEIQSD